MLYILCGSLSIMLFSCKPGHDEKVPVTTNGIGLMLGSVGDMPAQPTIEDFRALHKTLNVRFQTILKQCTMRGEAHNQLHNYLMPLKEKIDLLASADLDTCKKMLPELKEYIMKYSHFFFT